MFPQETPETVARDGVSRRAVLGLGLVGAALALTGLPSFTSPAHALVRPQGAALVPDADAVKLWYRSPGTVPLMIEEGLAIGNGRLGGLITGDPGADTTYLSDCTLWLGGINLNVVGGGQLSYTTEQFGSAQMLATTTLHVDGHDLAGVTGYRRELDLSNGVVRVGYAKGGVAYDRTSFASHPDDVVVTRLGQRGGGTYRGRFVLAGTHGEATGAATGSTASNTTVTFSGAFDNGLRYGAAATVVAPDGTVRVEGGEIVFDGCSELLIIVSGGTDYRPTPETEFKDPSIDPTQIAVDRLDAAREAGFDDLLASHVEDHRRLFEAQTVDLGTSSAEQRSMDTWTRLKARAGVDAAPDPELEANYLQFGRYLTIAGSRDSLPINLQGPWLEGNAPEWKADYHTDINIQMNYWLTDRARLGECFDALTDYCLSQLSSWEHSTQTLFQDSRNGFRNTSERVAGWTVAISTNIYGGGGWWWNPTGGAWLTNTLFDHYDFTQDTAFLDKIYPLLKGACDFWEARLITTTVTDPDTGESREVLIDDHDWSAEHGPTNARGITYAQELVWQLFANLQTASRVLGRDAEYASMIEGLQDRLHLPRVSAKTGWLQEWMTDDNLGDTTHRHLSPLVGVFPGDRINTDDSPEEIIDGVRNMLIARGMDSYGWATSWRGLCWARLKNANRAYRTVLNVIKPSLGGSNGTCTNFFDMYSFGSRAIFQIDANMGTPTTMLEMLVYSRPGVIELLPASPEAWGTGRVTQVGARGGFVVDLEWKDRQVTAATITSVGGTDTLVRYGTWEQQVSLASGQSVVVHPPAREYHDEPETVAPTTYQFVNRGTGKAIDVPNSSTTPGTKLIQWSPSSAANQRWLITDLGDGKKYLTSVASNLLAEIGGGVTTAGAAVTQWSNTGGDSQMWRFTDVGGGYVKIVNVRSGLLLSVEGQSTADGAKLVQLADTGHASQQWELRTGGPNVTATAQVRCLQSKSYLQVTATNNDTRPVAMKFTTPYGTKSFVEVGPGKSATHTFTVRKASVPAGEITVQAVRLTGGVTASRTVAYAAATCG